MVNACVQQFDLYKLPKSKLANANILCLVRFSSDRNKLLQLLIRSRNSGGQTVRSRITIKSKQICKFLFVVRLFLGISEIESLERLVSVMIYYVSNGM